LSETKTILALDAAGAACSVAVWAEDGIRAQAAVAMARGQSERLIPMIEEVMAEADLDYGEIDAIAVTRGPGGFTGVRIGLAAAQGLAIALARPLVGVSNFEALAASVRGVPAGSRLVAAIDSKRAEVYVQVFRRSGTGAAVAEKGPGAAVLEGDLASLLPSGPLLLVGDGAPRAATALRAAGREVSLAPAPGPCIAALAARLAAARPLPGAVPDPPRPIYLRGPDVTLPDGRKIQAPNHPPG
jgi:tRNA threonylcarbamoyladenosine biosynthesis protein TsaB